mgnify:FL=1
MKKTVFISSTYQDLAEHRRAIWQILEQFDVDVRGMEQFGARTEAPLETCVAEVEQADVYVGVVGFRLGSIDPPSGKSFTQVEYDRAVQLRKSILIYLADEDTARVRYADIEIDPQARERLAAFKATLRERHTVSAFSTPEDLAEKLKRDFARELEPKEMAPTANEFEGTDAVVRRFMLLPQTVVGREVRLRVGFCGGAFPASRALCKAFNLPYGATVGSHVTVTAPDGDAKKFREMYATGATVDQFLNLSSLREPVDIYVRLQFSEQDIHRIKGEFFGYSYYYDDEEPGDPYERYVSPEGKAMLLFSKAPA